MTFDTGFKSLKNTSGSVIQTYRSMQLETISSKIYHEHLDSFYGLSVAACNLSRYHSSATVTQSIADFSGVDRARISFHRHSSLFQDHGVDRACRCVTYAFVVPRAFTPWTRRTHLESLIRRLTSRAFLNSPALFVPFLVSSPVPRSLCFFFPFHFCQLFLFPPIEAACHWTWLGDLVASFVNGIFSVAFFVAKGEQVKWDSRLRYWTFLVTFIGRRMNGPANWIDW